MRQWSCNRLPINNALVSGARARAHEEEEEELEKKKKEEESKREVEGWRTKEEGETSARRYANVVDRASRVRARRRRGGISSLPVRYTNRVYASPDRCAVNGG